MGRAPKELSSAILAELRQVLRSVDENLPVVEAPEFKTLVNYSARADEPVHSWFRYREGYSTQLVERLVQGTKPGSLVLDPFCGAGTTLLVARNQGRPSVGVDANPLSAFVARVKTRNYSSAQLKRFEDICYAIEKLDLEDEAADKPKLKIIDKVFLPEVLRTLLVLKHFINTHLDEPDRDFFFLAWLSILEKVSNVFREGNGIKYRNRKRTPSGYTDIPIDIWQQSLFPEDKFPYVVDVFLSRVRMMMEEIRSAGTGSHEPEVFTGDARYLDEFVEANSAGLIAFSPPYANNFNYFKAYKLELWMGGFVADYDELRELTRSSLRSHVETQLVRESDSKNWYPEELDQLLNLIDPDTLWTPRILSSVRGYFYDMRDVLENAFQALKPGARCVIVVGNSAYGSTLIPTDGLLAKIALEEGFEVEKVAVARHLTTSSQQKRALEPVRDYLRESILYLTKPEVRSKSSVSENGAFRYRYVKELPKFPRESSSTVYVIRNQGLTDLTHTIHKYPGKFIPHVPRWAFSKYLGREEGKVILDPFCGSGTSLVEAHLAGHNAYGIDIDPLARLVSKVKTTPLKPSRLLDAIETVVRQVNTTQESNFRPQIDTLDHWFTPTASRDLGVVREIIEQWRQRDPDLYDFLIVCFSAIIRRVSNADNQSLKTYVSGTHPKKPLSVKPLFERTLREYTKRIIQFGEKVSREDSTTILEVEDATSFADYWFSNELPSVDLAITSPPYIKTIDYIYNQMAEYFWIGDLFDLDNQSKQNDAKRRYIGTDKLRAVTRTEIPDVGVPGADAHVSAIFDKSAKHAHIAAQYFVAMRSHFRNVYRVLGEQGHYVVVIGDSNISGLNVPTHELLAETAKNEGFTLKSQFAYEIRNRYMRFPRQGRGGLVDLDWILTLRKNY